MSVDRIQALIDAYVKAVPTPSGFTSREIVRRAIEFDDPPRVPYSFIDPLESDFVELAAIVSATGSVQMAQVPQGEMAFDEWGVGWRSSGRAWGHAEVTPLADLSALDGYKFPEVVMTERVAVAKVLADAGNKTGKYVVGADPINAYERLRSLMGFDNMMMAMYADQERFEKLLDKLVEMTVGAVEAYAGIGAHGFMSWDDWGLQTSLQIKPAKWRETFKPRYGRIVDACHKNDMHYILHSCGVIWDIIPDMIEISMDVLQIDQPRLMGVERLANEFGGKICFWNCVDIQWSVAEEASLEDVRLEASDMMEQFSRFKGGFMARQYPQPRDIEMSPEKHHAIYEAFMEAGCR